jgi:hypothetical protein
MTPDRLVDLLVKRASEGVTAQEQAEIERLSATHKSADLESMERAAAAVALAGLDEEPMPADVRARLEKTAASFIASRELVKEAPPDTSDTARTADELAARRQKKQAGAPSARSSRLAWFAVAASLLIAIAGWWPRLTDLGREAPIAETPPETPQVEEPGPEPTLAEQRATLLASNQDLVRGSWTPPGDPATNPVAGDIVWDPDTQQGYVRFTGLASNDPTQYQYQLWIFDAEQDERYPIDGGVFDIPPGEGEVIVKIDPAIAVKSPVMFAVTAEKPGGVVVSSREQIVALAKVATG